MMPLITMGILVARTSSRSWATVLGSTAVSFEESIQPRPAESMSMVIMKALAASASRMTRMRFSFGRGLMPAITLPG
jgi:hypothetical protein